MNLKIKYFVRSAIKLTNIGLDRAFGTRWSVYIQEDETITYWSVKTRPSILAKGKMIEFYSGKIERFYGKIENVNYNKKIVIIRKV